LFTLALLSWGWNHRGTVVRAAGLLREAPDLIRSDRRDDLLTGLRSVLQLDRNAELARRTDVRIDAVEDGVVTLTAPTSTTDVALARALVAEVPGVSEVRATSPATPIEERTPISA
jgi:hypothetical protein